MTYQALVEVPEGAKFGPQMSVLNSRQQAFVLARFALGNDDPVAAARAAGYPDIGKSGIRVQAFRLEHNPKVRAAMQEHAQAVLQGFNPMMVRLLKEMAETPGKEQLKAILAVMNRSGLHATTEVKNTHEHILTYDESVLELHRLALLAGDDPDKVIAGLAPPPAVVTDAEFEEVEEYEPSIVGLEDLL